MLVATTTELEQWRCQQCQRLLARVSLSAGSSVEIKCRNCNAVNVLRCVPEASNILVSMMARTAAYRSSS